MADGPEAVVRALAERGLTLATGESVTAGLVAATLADVPGCSTVLRGAVVAYQADVKAGLLAVPDAALREGIVSAAVAQAMADAAATLMGADVGIGTTGVAGPDPHDGQPVGTVWIAIRTPEAARTRLLALAGDRGAIRRQTVEACWGLVLDTIGG